MTRRDIVKAAIAHTETENIPYCITFTEGTRQKIQEYIPGEDLSLGIGNYVYLLKCPWWKWSAVPECYKEFDPPSVLPAVKGEGSYEEFAEKLIYLKEQTDCYILVTIYGSHFEKAYFARGIENFLADLAYNKDFAKKLLDTIIYKNIVMLENILDFNEIDGILLGSDWGSQNSLLMSPSVWRNLIAPGELKEYELIKSAGKDVWIHSCGNIEEIIPDMIDMKVDVLNPVQPEAMDIYMLKRKYGDRIAFWGGISTQKTLPYGTPEDVKRETNEVIRQMSKGGGYIAAPAQSIQEDVPIENILALLETVRKYKRACLT